MGQSYAAGSGFRPAFTAKGLPAMRPAIAFIAVFLPKSHAGLVTTTEQTAPIRARPVLPSPPTATQGYATGAELPTDCRS